MSAAMVFGFRVLSMLSIGAGGWSSLWQFLSSDGWGDERLRAFR
jgi:hypothetical protein